MWFDDTQLPWVLPSPNIPTLDTAVVYPGAVLFEGTRLSEGRGTTRPFELIGAPWIDGERFADAMNARGLAGAIFRAVFFEPTFHKHAKHGCGGVQLHVTDRTVFRPVFTGVLLTEAFRSPANPSRRAEVAAWVLDNASIAATGREAADHVESAAPRSTS